VAKGVKDIDRGWQDIVKMFKQQRRGVASAVGVQGVEAMANREGISNAELAAVHEFGTKDRRIPERSFLRSTFDENKGEYKRDIDKLVGQTVDRVKAGAPSGLVLEGELRLLGEDYRKDILRRINAGIRPDLKPATKKRKKGETTPLIDTGQLRNSISVVVEDRTALPRT